MFESHLVGKQPGRRRVPSLLCEEDQETHICVLFVICYFSLCLFSLSEAKTCKK